MIFKSKPNGPSSPAKGAYRSKKFGVALWIGNPGVSPTTNWSDTANWNNIGGGAGALQNDAKFGGTGAGADLNTITSFVDVNQAPLSLQYSNASQAATLQFHHTVIPTGVTLSVGNGPLTIGGITADGYRTQVKMSGGGTLVVTNNLNIGNNGVGSADTQTLLDLSELSNFVFKAASATVAMSSGNRSAADFRMAAISNSMTAATFNANTLSSSSSYHNTLIPSGKSLAVTNILTVGTLDTTTSAQHGSVTISGGGSLSVGNSSANLQVWNGFGQQPEYRLAALGWNESRHRHEQCRFECCDRGRGYAERS